MRKKRVLFLVQLPEPVHGASIANQQLVDNSKLFSNEIEIDVVDISTSQEMSDLGIFSIRKITTFLKLFINVIYKSHTSKYDAVYVTLSPYGFAFYKDILLTLAGSRFKKLLCIYHLHGKGVRNFTINVINKIVYKYAFSGNRVIQLSKKLYSDIEHVAPRSSVDFINNGVPGPDITNQKNKFKREGLVLLYLSNFMSEKGSYELLCAVEALISKGFDIKCHFVGKFFEPDFKLKFMKKVSTINSYRINVEEGLYGKEKNKIFTESDVFVLPTYYKNESFPISILEAMSFSLPVISTDEGAITDIVKHNVNGLIIEKKSIVALENTILRLVLNPDLVRSMSARSRKIYEDNYTQEKFINQVYSRIIELV